MLRDWNHNEHKYFFWSFPDKIIFQYTLSLIPLQLCVNLYPSIRKFFLCSSSNPLLSQCCSIFFEYVLCQTISPHNTVMSVIDIIPWCFNFFYSSFPFFFVFPFPMFGYMIYLNVILIKSENDKMILIFQVHFSIGAVFRFVLICRLLCWTRKLFNSHFPVNLRN